MNRALILAGAVLIGSSVGAQQNDPAPSNPPPQSSPAETSSASDQKANDQPSPPGTSNEAQPEKPASSAAQSDNSAPKNSRQTAKGRKKRRGKKPPDNTAVSGEPRKIVVHRGGTRDVVAQIMPGISEEEATRQRQDAEKLLGQADTDLHDITGRTLSTDQQETIVQIRQYMDGAREALREGDTQRAHTLALKAQLLSDDLKKH